jgi:hypothetical protein
MAIVLPAFVAFCVMVGLHWSIRSKGTIGSVVAAVFIVLSVVGLLSMCGLLIGGSLDVVGGVTATFSPITLLFAIVRPDDAIAGAIQSSVMAGRISLIVGACITAAVYGAVVYAMHNNQKRTFMMTVRKLAGQA